MPVLHIENFTKGMVTAKEPFLIPPSAFADLENVIATDGRLERKGGYNIIGTTAITHTLTVTSDAHGVFNLAFTAPSDESDNIVFGSITLSVTAGGTTTTYQDFQSGLMFSAPALPQADSVGVVDYIAKTITISSLASTSATITFSRHPCLPVSAFFELGPKIFCADYKYFYEIQPENSFFAYGAELKRQQKYLHSNLDFQWGGFRSTTYRGISGIENENKLYVTNGQTGKNFFAITAITKGSTNTTIRVNTDIPDIDASFITNISNNVSSGNLKGYIFGVRGMWGVNDRVVDITSFTRVASTDNYDIVFALDSSAFTDYTSAGVFQFLNVSADVQNGIKTFDGTGWANFNPPVTSPGNIAAGGSIANPLEVTYLVGADFFVNFFGYFFAFGTRESTATGASTYHPTRIRYAVGAPTYFTDTDLNSFGAKFWYSDVRLRGYEITSSIGRNYSWARVINNVCMVGIDRGAITLSFESGGLPDFPIFVSYFNSALGVTSLNSSAHMDRFILAAGPQGILHYQPRATLLKALFEVNRIDQDVYNFVENIDFTGAKGQLLSVVRDTVKQLIYVNYVSRESFRFPDETIVINYKDGTFSKLKERFTAQHSFEIVTRELQEDPTWEGFLTDRGITWEDIGQERWKDFKSRSSLRQSSVGGTSQGIILQRVTSRLWASDLICTSMTLQNNKTTLLTCTNHSLNDGDYIQVVCPLGIQFNDNKQIFKVSVIDNNSVQIDGAFTGTYKGGGRFRVIESFKIRTKEFIDGWPESKILSISYIKFLVQTSNKALPITLNVYVGHDRDNPVHTETMVLNNRQFVNANSLADWLKSNESFINSSVQFELTLSEDNLRNIFFSDAEFKLHAINLMLELVGELD